MVRKMFDGRKPYLTLTSMYFELSILLDESRLRYRMLVRNNIIEAL